MLQMLITFAIRLHWVCYWLIYTEKIRCLSSLVDIYICLFNQKWLGTPVIGVHNRKPRLYFTESRFKQKHMETSYVLFEIISKTF